MTHLKKTLAAASLLLLPSVGAAGLYPPSGPVVNVDGSTYKTLIANSNHTSILEFYAPWCGHCQNLKPAYEKAAKSLTGLAKVAAVNCDDEANKPFCGGMGVQGFPTLKIVRPGKAKGKPTVEDYQGQRSAKAIVDAVVEKIPNHVRRLKHADYQAWLEEGDGPKAVLFSDKGTTSALLKAIAIDFLGSIGVAQIRNREVEAVEVFNIAKYPTLVLLPGNCKDPVHYDGEMKREPMVAFLSQAASPNPDPAPKEKKAGKSSRTDKGKSSKASSSFSEASASHASEEAKTAKASQTAETLEDSSKPTESPNPNVVTDDTQTPVKLQDVAPPIPSLPDGLSLQQKCLNSKAGTCILALLPEPESGTESGATSSSPSTTQAIASLSEIHHKHSLANRPLFPFYQLLPSNSQADAIRNQIGLSATSAEVELIAINGKRSWYRHYTSSSFSQAEVEDWIDAIRMGGLPKKTIPAGLILDAADLPPEEVEVDVDDMEKLKAQMPEGMDLQMEEISEEEYERMMAAGSAAGVVPEGEPRIVPEAEKEQPEEPPLPVSPDEHDEL